MFKLPVELSDLNLKRKSIPHRIMQLFHYLEMTVLLLLLPLLVLNSQQVECAVSSTVYSDIL